MRAQARLAAAIAIALAGAHPGSAQARHAKHVHCGRSSIAAVVNRRHVCLPLPHAAPSLTDDLNSLGGWPPVHEPKRLRRVAFPSWQRLIDSLTANAGSVTPHVARARSASVPGSASQITGTPPDGLDRSGVWYPETAGASGLPAGATQIAESQPYSSSDGMASGFKLRSLVTLKPGQTMGVDSDMGATVACPDRQGFSPGDAHFSLSRFQQLSAGGQSVWARLSQQADATLLARTNDQGKVTDYDVDATMIDAVTGGDPVRGRTTPLMAVAHVSLRHLPVGIGLHWFADQQYIAAIDMTITGGQQSNPERSIFVLLSDVVAEADKELASVSANQWNGCLNAVFSPDSYQFKPRESHQVQVLVDSKRTGPQTVPMDLQATTSGYSVTPAHDQQGMGTPASFTLTAPASKPASAYLAVSGVGKQGEVSGSFTPGFQPPLSNRFDIEFKGSADFWLQRTILDPSTGTSSTQLYQGSPTWDTLSGAVEFPPVQPYFSTVSDNQIDTEVGGQATVTIDGNLCQTPIVDASPGTGLLTSIRSTPDGGAELILAGGFEYASPKGSSCFFDMGPLNPGGSLTTASPTGFDPTEATQLHLVLTKAQLDAIGPGQSLQIPVAGPTDPFTLNFDCGSTGNVTCHQRLSWHGTVTLERYLT